ncbi:hypothetical protein VTK56DRAFT_8773 [Thermocarpiscus australiensis]
MSEGSSGSEGLTAGSKESPVSQNRLRTLGQDNRVHRTAAWVTNPEPETLPRTTYKVGSSANAMNGAGNSSGDPILPHRPQRPHRERARARDETSAIRGNFIPVSSPFKERSPSPRREQPTRDIYLQLSLTDSQMDKLTAVLSSDNEETVPRGRQAKNGNEEKATPSMRSRSPTKIPVYQSTNTPARARSRSPVKYATTPDSRRVGKALEADMTARPTKIHENRVLRNAVTADESPTPAAKREGRKVPAPIDTDIAGVHARLDTQREGRQLPIVVQRPLEEAASPVRQPIQHPAVIQHPPEKAPSPVQQANQPAISDDTPSVYSQDAAEQRYPSCVSPLRIEKDRDGTNNNNVFQKYTDWRNTHSGSHQGSEGLAQPGNSDIASSDLQFTPWLTSAQGLPRVRIASKTLIGEKGWLEDTSKPTRPPPTTPSRSGRFLGNLVKKAKEMIEAGQEQGYFPSSGKSRLLSGQLTISLNPREQSLLYCELEFLLTTVLNDYITIEFNRGRLSTDKLKKVAEEWRRKGFPKVVGFRYDMETQLDLVKMHANDFKFYSYPAATAGILAIINTMQVHARTMRIRTFCKPDKVIVKELNDTSNLFNILGCPQEQHIKLAEIHGFLKAAIAREEHYTRKPQQPQQEQQEPLAAGTAPMHPSKSPKQGDRWWATTGHNQLPGEDSYGGANMDPAGYDLQNE